MSLLSDEKIEELWRTINQGKFMAAGFNTFARAIEAAAIESQENQEPFPFSAKRVTYHKAGAIGAIMPCGTMVTNVKEAYEAGQAAAPVVQPDMVLVPREPTEEMLAVIRNERGAYGTGESLYADLIAAAEGKK